MKTNLMRYGLFKNTKNLMRYGLFNPLKTSPEYTRAGGLWEMRVVAKSVRLQRVKILLKPHEVWFM